MSYVLVAAQQHAGHVHGHELTAMDVTAVPAADNAGGPVTSTSHDERPTSSFATSSACVGGLSSKRPRSVKVLRDFSTVSRTCLDSSTVCPATFHFDMFEFFSVNLLTV